MEIDYQAIIVICYAAFPYYEKITMETVSSSNHGNSPGVRYRDSRVVNVEIVRRVIVGVLTGIKSVPKGTEANLTCSGEGMFIVQRLSILHTTLFESQPNFRKLGLFKI